MLGVVSVVYGIAILINMKILVVKIALHAQKDVSVLCPAMSVSTFYVLSVQDLLKVCVTLVLLMRLEVERLCALVIQDLLLQLMVFHVCRYVFLIAQLVQELAIGNAQVVQARHFCYQICV